MSSIDAVTLAENEMIDKCRLAISKFYVKKSDCFKEGVCLVCGNEAQQRKAGI
jgi:hypothetical protein